MQGSFSVQDGALMVDGAVQERLNCNYHNLILKVNCYN